jgi:hypothetical protein|tara:strand:+ start:922 stop:1260 length:339 start_codon:yes stop_codon:yes gene_type:complete
MYRDYDFFEDYASLTDEGKEHMMSTDLEGYQAWSDTLPRPYDRDIPTVEGILASLHLLLEQFKEDGQEAVHYHEPEADALTNVCLRLESLLTDVEAGLYQPEAYNPYEVADI